MELAVYVTAHRHRAFLFWVVSGTLEGYPTARGATYHWLDIRLLLQNLSCLQSPNRQFESRPRSNKEPTRSHSRRTSSSANCLHVIKLSIQPSKVGMEPGSLAGDRWCGSGDRAVSISMLLSMVGTAGEIGGGASWRGGLVRTAPAICERRGSGERLEKMRTIQRHRNVPRERLEG